MPTGSGAPSGQSYPRSRPRACHALTVRQPWAWLICQGLKDVENRKVRTARRGRIVIHAGRTLDFQAVDYFREWLPENRDRRLPSLLPGGVIVGSVELVDCVKPHGSPFYKAPLWAWVLADPRVCRVTVPARGSLGFWRVGEAELGQLQREGVIDA